MATRKIVLPRENAKNVGVPETRKIKKPTKSQANLVIKARA